MAKRPEWSEDWIALLKEHSYQEALDLLNQHTGEKRKTPNTIVKSQAIDLTIENLKPSTLYETACRLAVWPHPTAKEIATFLLIEVYGENPAEVMERLYLLADDEDWEVREWAASACGKRLIDDFDGFYPQLTNWIGAESPNVRRATALAVKYACRPKKTEWAEPLLNLIEPLLSDSDAYVKKNLGPFTIGDALLRAYPDDTLRYLKKWIKWDDVNIRWNIAKVFTTSEGAKMVDQAIPLLKVLINDQRKEVQRAMKSAMNNLKRRKPEIYELLQKESSL